MVIYIKLCRKDIQYLILFILIAIFMTFPMILNLDSNTGTDRTFFLWGLWWLKQSIIDNINNGNIFYSYHVFYPIGIDLTYFPLSLVNWIIGLPFQLIFNEAYSYNIISIISFIIAGYGTYKLIEYFTHDKKASFLSSLIFVFSPLILSNFPNQSHVFSIQWIPFFILYLFKSKNEDGKKNIILTSIFLVLIAYTSLILMGIALMFSILFFIYYSFTEKKKFFKFTKKFISIILIFLLLFSPYLINIMSEYSSSDYASRPIEPAIYTSADILSFFSYPSQHPILGKYFSNINENLLGRQPSDKVAFIGYSIILLLLFSIYKIDKKKYMPWIIIGLFFLILSLGPVLTINGTFAFSFKSNLGDLAKNIGIKSSSLGYELMNNFIGVPLPYLVFHMFVPFFSIFREPIRFAMIFMLSTSVICGYGLSYIFKKYQKYSKIIFIGFLFIILFEFYAIPRDMEMQEASPFFSEIGKDNGSYVIAYIPLEGGMFEQTIHNKRMLGGLSTRRPPETNDFINNNTLLLELNNKTTIRRASHIRYLDDVIESNPELEPFIREYMETHEDLYNTFTFVKPINEPSQTDITNLINYNIKYIIINKESYNEKEIGEKKYLLENLGITFEYEDEYIVVYKLF